MVSTFYRKSIIVLATGVALSWANEPQPAAAGGFGGFGGFAGAFAGAVARHMMGGGGGRGYSSGYRSRPVRAERSYGGAPYYSRWRKSPAGEPARADTPKIDTSDPDAGSTKALASLAPSSKDQVATLKTVVPSSKLGSVGSIDDLDQLGATASKESERDYLSRIETLIKKFKEKQQASTGEGDITAHAIEVALDNAIKEAKLDTFESFLGEDWSEERLRVMTLDLVDAQINPLFEGTNRGRVAMSEVDGIIKKSARAVYIRLFETSELLAANCSFALFVQNLYQATGVLGSGGFRENAERALMKASSGVTVKFDAVIRKDESSFALRYRLQRIVFDCLGANVARITASDGGPPTREEIEQRIGTLSQNECTAWVTAQFIGEGGKLKPQQPMPLRAVWSASGPKDDASMYGHASLK